MFCAGGLKMAIRRQCEYRSLNANNEMIWCNTTIYLIESGDI